MIANELSILGYLAKIMCSLCFLSSWTRDTHLITQSMGLGVKSWSVKSFGVRAQEWSILGDFCKTKSVNRFHFMLDFCCQNNFVTFAGIYQPHVRPAFHTCAFEFIYSLLSSLEAEAGSTRRGRRGWGCWSLRSAEYQVHPSDHPLP